MKHQISSQHLDFNTLKQIIESKAALELSEDAVKRIAHCRSYLDVKVGSLAEPVYGINTGFGSLYNKSIDVADLGKLQENLVMSHACGCGDEVPVAIVKLMLLLKIQGLSYGNSGVQLQTVQRLIDFYNHEIFPVVYTQGSLGASGDLAPLAHLCLPLIGMGEVYFNGKKVPSAEVLNQFGWQPIKLQSKEGLALLNGTQFMNAYGTYAVMQSQRLMLFADIIGALSLDAFDGRIEPFHHLIHQIRPHKGQIATALRYRQLLSDSEMISRKKAHVQDPIHSGVFRKCMVPVKMHWIM